MHLHPTHERPFPEPDNRRALPVAQRGSRTRRRLLWAGIVLVVLVLLAVLPPLINANRYRLRIADSMSRSLGRPVHLDAVSLHLLPVPGFTLSNFVVSEDPVFGAEPTIRANTVEATLRVSSLWRRPVEFSTVRFVEPSLNLVRNADGRWNVNDILLHASRVDSAPTAQRQAGPAPRFPYIEATGGRINLKLGNEKLPFSLTDANFALWLPSPQQWSVRLVASPARTDRNITDPGRLRIEGHLRRAAHIGEIPAHFQASWHDAPLGEASTILAGEDWGWRGALNLDAELNGTLGNGQLSTKLTLGGLRRAAFFPAEPLDLQLTCGSGFAVHPAALLALQCTLPDDAPTPLQLQAQRISLLSPSGQPVAVRAQAVPMRWALLWAALFSARVPTDLHPAGHLDLDALWNGAASPATVPATGAAALRPVRRGRSRLPHPAVTSAALPGWTGTLAMTLPVPGAGTSTDGQENHLLWQILPAQSGRWPILHLPATALSAGNGGSLNLSASVESEGYTLAGSGTLPAAAVLEPARYLPQLGDGLPAVLPYPASGADAVRVQFTCVRSWPARQSCTGPQPSTGIPAALPVTPAAAGEATGRQANRLAPQNLSPLERAPFSTPRPGSPQP